MPDIDSQTDANSSGVAGRTEEVLVSGLAVVELVMLSHVLLKQDN